MFLSVRMQSKDKAIKKTLLAILKQLNIYDDLKVHVDCGL